ncbi:MAG: hypothetical protein Ct9H300mP27_00320 [Chloroflexota bacterium]|nr:MAG: hypothetical protein Ct9H300mP27_00320 [Chloroflexota bacterium]
MQDSPPIAPQKQQELTAHGDIRIDPWYWIQNMEDPDTLEYLNSENSFTEHIFEPWAEQRERLFTEMRARIKEDDSTVPSKEGIIGITLNSKRVPNILFFSGNIYL